MVYNKNFVETNFGETIGGIFTLGEDSKEAQDFITQKRLEYEDSVALINGYISTIQTLKTEQEKAQTAFEDSCWSTQQTYGPKFADALVGFRGSKAKFAEKCLESYVELGDDALLNVETLEELYAAAYGDTKEKYNLISLLDSRAIENNEKCDLLDVRITGSADTPIGAFIEFLQNSDWIKQGISYASRAEGKCPYCQQLMPENVQQDITAFFDESYERDCAKIKAFTQQYSSFMDAILDSLHTIINTPNPILDYALFNAEIQNLSKIIESNKKILSDKLNAPSNKVLIESVKDTVRKLNEQIVGFNDKINRNNDIVKDQSQNRIKCQSELWRFFAYELRVVISQFRKKITGLDKGRKALNEKKHDEEEKKRVALRLIEDKEETLTSVLPTVTAINSILERFGFTGFKLAENMNKKGTYKILRPDGSDAKKTLSEGEHNFIAFLYFFHLVYGSFDRTGIAQNKVVVIDDPISSLDSNVLFIITTLVKTILTDCVDEKNGIKQVFILTHNVYFHKEVTFRGSRSQYPATRTVYWVIRKKENASVIDRYENNPIQTSYELLWTELKDTESSQRVTIFNTLRRILEYYFNIIGGLDYEKCINEFEGQDKIICKALIASINDGSHFISDDFVMCYESDSLENYLRVFRLIFDKMGHISHYTMMMGESGAMYGEPIE